MATAMRGLHGIRRKSWLFPAGFGQTANAPQAHGLFGVGSQSDIEQELGRVLT